MIKKMNNKEKFLCYVCNKYIVLNLEKDKYECPFCRDASSLIPEKVVKGIKDFRIG